MKPGCMTYTTESLSEARMLCDSFEALGHETETNLLKISDDKQQWIVSVTLNPEAKYLLYLKKPLKGGGN